MHIAARLALIVGLAIPAICTPVPHDEAATEHGLSKRWFTEEIDLGYEIVQGFQEDGLNKYFGIRYASAARLQAPHTPELNKTIYQALNHSVQCWQSSNYNNQPLNPNGTEDCLKLDIYAPQNASAGSGYPVMFWIHGGGYEKGNTQSFDWTNFVQTSNDAGTPIVVVGIQYRLGAQGFLAGQAVKDNGKLNAGLLDQQFALQWVQEHISKFGGNSSHVTIWGESAGAGSVMSQVIANGGNTQGTLNISEPLFHAAIGSSVFLPPQHEYTDAIAEGYYQQMLNATNCGDFNCLIALDEVAFATASSDIGAAAYYGYWVWVPVVDGSFLTDRPTQLIQQKKYNAKHIIDFHNTNEGFVFTQPLLANNNNLTDGELASDFDGFLKGYLPHLDESGRAAIAAEYPIESYPRVNNTFARSNAVSSDAIFVCPSLKLAEYAPEGYGYLGWYALNASLHGQDVASYSGDFEARQSESFSDAWVGAILSVILTYSPNNNPLTNSTSITPCWPSIDNQASLLFNVSSVDGPSDSSVIPLDSNIPRDSPRGIVAKCDFWFGNISAQVPF